MEERHKREVYRSKGLNIGSLIVGILVLISFIRRDDYLIRSVRNEKMFFVRYYLFIGADINHRDDAGKTPLIISVENDSVKIAEFLIEQGADVNAEDDLGQSAPEIAEIWNDPEMMNLFDEGA